MTSIIGTSIRSSMALLVTVGLFGIMMSLVVRPPVVVEESKSPKIPKIIQDEPYRAPVITEIVEPPIAIEPTPPMVRPQIQGQQNATGPITVTYEPPPTVVTGENPSSSGSLASIVTVAPVYPPRAVQKGIEGHCTVEFVVTAAGTTRDVGVVEDDCTHSIFWRASIKAAQKFKYAPKREGGVAVASYGVKKRFTYNLE